MGNHIICCNGDYMSKKVVLSSFVLSVIAGLAAVYYWVGFARPAQGNSMDYNTDAQLVTVTEIVGNIEHPWAVQFLPDGDFLISERSGRLLYGTTDGNVAPIANVPAVYDNGQGGLLDIALSPDYATDGLIYFSYAAADRNGNANTEVARAKLNIADKTLENIERIFQALPKVKGNNHFGSRLQFDNDRHLFITLGERFSYSDNAQNTSDHLGTVIRIHGDGSIPADNPFVNDPNSRPEIFSFGHRNIQGMAKHPETGEIWIHEHGPRGGDEINILQKGGNYGWPKVSYGVHYSGIPVSSSPTGEGYIDPVLHWTPSIAPSGMIFYNGKDFPQWRGDILVGALAQTHLRRVVLDGSSVTDQTLLLQDFERRIRDIAVSPDGKLYVLTDEYEGGLYRIDPAQ